MGLMKKIMKVKMMSKRKRWIFVFF